jgi:hypothetical protein
MLVPIGGPTASTAQPRRTDRRVNGTALAFVSSAILALACASPEASSVFGTRVSDVVILYGSR